MNRPRKNITRFIKPPEASIEEIVEVIQLMQVMTMNGKLIFLFLDA